MDGKEKKILLKKKYYVLIFQKLLREVKLSIFQSLPLGKNGKHHVVQPCKVSHFKFHWAQQNHKLGLSE